MSILGVIHCCGIVQSAHMSFSKLKLHSDYRFVYVV